MTNTAGNHRTASWKQCQDNKILTIFTKLSIDSWWAATLASRRVAGTSILTRAEAATIFPVGPRGTGCNESVEDECAKLSSPCIRD